MTSLYSGFKLKNLIFKNNYIMIFCHIKNIYIGIVNSQNLRIKYIPMNFIQSRIEKNLF